MTGSRRRFLQAGGAAAVLAALGIYTVGTRRTGAVAPEAFEVTHTDEEWKKILTPNQFKVLREAATERPFSSPLNDEHRHGVFGCAGCDLDLYSSETKFDSGTGWPSFYQPLQNAIGTTRDTSLAHGSHGRALPALRRPLGPRVRRRAEADGSSLLHERARDEVQSRLSAPRASCDRESDAAVRPRVS